MGKQTRAAIALAGLLLVSIVAAGCGGDGGATAGIGVFPIASDLKVGENRLPFALIDKEGRYLEVRPNGVKVTYMHQQGGSPQRAAGPFYRKWPGRRGVYVATANFDRPGIWLMDVTVDGHRGTFSAGIEVRNEARTPEVGEAAPLTPSKVAGPGTDLATITSDVDPDPRLYSISLDDAIRSGRPVVVSFSTPLYCATQTCGPQLDEVSQLRDRFGDSLHYIHVEIYDNPHEIQGDLTRGRTTPAALEWGLPSEPWTFVVDRDGKVAAKFEAFTTSEELAEAVEKAL